MQVKGTVDNVYSITKNTRSGDKTIYYGDVDGTTVNLGFKPLWEEGEYISVNVEEKYGELQISRGGAAPKKPATKGKAFSNKGSAPSKSGGFPINPTDSQVSIIRQSSLNRAVETVRDQISAGVLHLASEKEYNEKVMELAYSYTDFATGQREVKMAQHDSAKRAALEAVNG